MILIKMMIQENKILHKNNGDNYKYRSHLQGSVI